MSLFECVLNIFISRRTFIFDKIVLLSDNKVFVVYNDCRYFCNIKVLWIEDSF